MESISFESILSLSQYIIPCVLQFIKHILLFRFYKSHFSSKSHLVLFSLITPFTIKQIRHQPYKPIIHVLILLLLTLSSIQLQSISLGVLTTVQPGYLLLIVPLHLNKNKQQIQKLLIYTFSTILITQSLAYFVNIDILKYYFSIYNPTHYQPSFNLIWFLFSHLFISYLPLFTILMFLIPLLFIYPLTVIFRNISYIPRLFSPIFTFCLTIIFYSSTQTSVSQIYLYFILLIADYWFHKHVPFSIVFNAGAITFIVIAELFFREWRSSFMVTVSYVFYMTMVAWLFIIAYQVEVFNVIVQYKEDKFGKLKLEKNNNQNLESKQDNKAIQPNLSKVK